MCQWLNTGTKNWYLRYIWNASMTNFSNIILIKLNLTVILVLFLINERNFTKVLILLLITVKRIFTAVLQLFYY